MPVDARRRGAGLKIPAPAAVPERKRLGLGRATLASASAQVVGVVATFAATPFLVGTLGVERYGVFAAVTVIGAQLTALQRGLSSAIPRRLAEVRARRDPSEHAATLASIALVTLAAAALVCLAARALSVSVGPRREFPIPVAALVSVVLFCQVAAPDAAWWARLAVGGAVSAGVAAWLIAPEDLRVVRTAPGMGPKLEGV